MFYFSKYLKPHFLIRILMFWGLYCVNFSLVAQGTTSQGSDTTFIEISSTGVELSYNVTEIQAKAGNVLKIRYINNSEMNHNIVFVHKEEDIRPVGIAAFQAIDTQWVPEKEMERIMAHSKLAHPGDTVNVSLTVPPPGTYPYICTYSGHWTQMQGRLISINND